MSHMSKKCKLFGFGLLLVWVSYNCKGIFLNDDEYKSSFLVISEVNHGLNCEKHPALDRYSQGLIESQNAVKCVQCTVYLIILSEHSK